MIRLEEDAANRRSPLDRIADRIAALVGTVGFVATHLAWYALWLSINTGLLPVLRPFDRYPFSLLCLLISMEAVLLTSFVLIKQNRMGIRSDRRDHLDLQVNLLAEREVTKVMNMLQRMSDHLGMPTEQCWTKRRATSRGPPRSRRSTTSSSARCRRTDRRDGLKRDDLAGPARPADTRAMSPVQERAKRTMYTASTAFLEALDSRRRRLHLRQSRQRPSGADRGDRGSARVGAHGARRSSPARTRWSALSAAHGHCAGLAAARRPWWCMWNAARRRWPAPSTMRRRAACRC